MKTTVLLFVLMLTACGVEPASIDAPSALASADGPAGTLFLAELRTQEAALAATPAGFFLPSRSQLLMIIDDELAEVPAAVWSNTVTNSGLAWVADPAGALAVSAAGEKHATLYLKVP